jgi:hypothetical protein
LLQTGRIWYKNTVSGVSETPQEWPVCENTEFPLEQGRINRDRESCMPLQMALLWRWSIIGSRRKKVMSILSCVPKQMSERSVDNRQDRIFLSHLFFNGGL